MNNVEEVRSLVYEFLAAKWEIKTLNLKMQQINDRKKKLHQDISEKMRHNPDGKFNFEFFYIKKKSGTYSGTPYHNEYKKDGKRYFTVAVFEKDVKLPKVHPQPIEWTYGED